MKAAYVVIFSLVAFAAGAFLTGALAQTGEGMMGMMSGEQMQRMMDACTRMMETGAAESGPATTAGA